MPSRSPNYSEQIAHNQIGTRHDLRFSYQLCYLWQLYDKTGHKTPRHFSLVVLLQPVQHVVLANSDFIADREPRFAYINPDPIQHPDV